MKEVRAFLGLTGYYRRFVQHYGVIAQPLTALLKKNAFEWSATTQDAWNNLKQALVTAPILALPDFSLIFIVEADACSTGVGAVLSQQGRPVAFFSKALSIQHQALSVYEKEMLAILIAVKKWNAYLLGRHFQIKTDHHSLKFLLNQPTHTPAQQKWVVKIIGYDYKIVYCKGSSNVVADTLSLLPHLELNALSV